MPKTTSDSIPKPAWGHPSLDRSEQFLLKRQAALRVAARAFNKYGFFRTSLLEIARELNINKATLYHYFESKDEILYEIHRIAIEAVTNHELRDNSERMNGAEHLWHFIDSYIDMLMDDFGACLVMTGINTLDAASHAKCVAGRREINSMLQNIIREGIADGSIADSDPGVTSAFIFGALNWICHWYHKDGTIKIDELKEKAKDFIYSGVLPVEK